MPRTHCNDHTEQSLSNALDLLLDLNLSGLGVAQHNVAGTRVGRLPSIALRDQPPWEQREKVGGRNDKVEELVVNGADELSSGSGRVVRKNQRSKLLEERARKGGCEGEMVRGVQGWVEILSDALNVLARRCNKVNRGNVIERWPLLMQTPGCQCAPGLGRYSHVEGYTLLSEVGDAEGRSKNGLALLVQDENLPHELRLSILIESC